MDWSSEIAGIRTWVLGLGVVVWLVMGLFWATGTVKGGFAVFLATLLSAAMATGLLAAAVARGKEPFRAARAIAVVGLSAAVPVVFDPHSGDVFNLPKYTVVVIGALVLAGLWALAGVNHRRLPRWRNGLQWVVGAVIVWTAVSALAGMDVHVGLLGNYGSYDGLYSAAAFGVIMMTAAEAFDVDDVRRALAALAFGGGTVVVVYGLIQLHDNEVHGPKWDFITWNLGSFTDDIFSTFGNPNHLGGYLAMILPAVLVLGLGAKRWPGRAAAGLLALAVLAELVRTVARGAWVAAIASLVVLAAMLVPELRRRPLLSAGGATGVVAVSAAGMAVGGTHFLSHPLSTLFQSGGTTSVEQRFEIWRAVLHIAVNHPITGIGPDTFALVYPRYQSAAWVAGLGASYLVNGAHDIFMNFLADQGFVGLALFVALLLFVGLRSAGAWRRLRSLERDENNGPALKERAQANRVSLAVVSASIVAYVVQAAFNVQQVGLTLIFWVLVGLSATVAQYAGVPDTLWPPVLLSTAVTTAGPRDGPTDLAAPARPSWTPHSVGTARRRARRSEEIPWRSLLATIVVAAVVVLLALGADAPYRADHDYWAAYTSLKQPGTAATSTSAPTAVGPAYFTDMQHAMSLNPWEPTYPVYEATVLTNATGHEPTSADAVSDLVRAHGLLAKAVAESPLWAAYPAAEAQVDMDLSRTQSSSAKAELGAAVSLARKAVRDNPRDSAYRTLLSQALSALRKASAKS